MRQTEWMPLSPSYRPAVSGRWWSSRRHPGLSRVLRVAGWVLAAALLGLDLARWTHLDVHRTHLIAASTGAPIVLMTAWLVLVPALWVRARLLAVVGVLLVASWVLVMVPLETGGRGASSGAAVRVMALNVEYDHDTGAAVTAQVSAADPDIVILSEVSPLTLSHLDLAHYGHASIHPGTNAFGEAIYSRWPITASATDMIGGTQMLEADIALPGGMSLHVQQVHTISPTSETERAQWRASLAQLQLLEAGLKGPWIMAGDFNSSRTDNYFHQLLGGTAGVADAADGHGLLTTWPSGRSFPPLLRLDHILIPRGVGVRRVRVLPAVGSDHRAMLADLTIG